MDPEARVVVTASDATGRAFASAEKNLRTFSRSVYQLRTVFAGFGVIVSGRMFANWVKDAIEVQKLTSEQAVAIGRASKAVGELNTAFGDLARTAVAELAPALEKAAKFWKEFLFPSGSQFGANADAIREQVDKQIQEVERLQRLLGGQVEYNANENWFQRFVFGDQNDSIAETTRQLAAARQELERLRTAWQSAMGGSGPDIMSGFHRIGDFADRNKGAKSTDISMDYLDEFEEIAVKARKISEDEILKPFPTDEVRKMFEPVKKEWTSFAQAAGAGLKDYFVDAFMGVHGSFKDLLKRMAAEMAISGIFSSLAAFFGKGTGAGSKFAANFFGGFRAQGGPLQQGKWYIAGEKGPEPVWGGGAGAFAAGYGAGGTPLQINVNVQAGLPPQWTAQLAVAGQAAASAAYDAVMNKMGGKR